MCRTSCVRQAKCAGEAPLWCGRRVADFRSYRFYWHRSFHSDWVIRVEVDGSLAVLEAAEAWPVQAHDTVEVVKRLRRQLLASNLESLKAALKAADFWNTPSELPFDWQTDGSTWTFEVLEAGRHRVVSRQNPDVGPIRRLGLAFLELAELSDQVDRIY